jgi:diketogulonate reductase-like aldo/keto reductase
MTAQHSIPVVALSGAVSLPALGLGTWRYGEAARGRAAETVALREAIEIGYRLFDSAEMYGEGGAEEVLGEALAEAMRAGEVKRDELFVVSKVYPHNASRSGTLAACERSLGRLRLDRIDLYLLHWRGQHPLAQTVDAFEVLRAQGRIGLWGVSNFDTDDMAQLWRVSGGRHCAINQVYYSLSHRGVEFDLVPWLRAHGVPLMAYCPIDQGVLARSKALRPIAERLNASPAQVALAWLVQRGGVIAIPMSAHSSHLRENFAALSLRLDARTLTELDALFAPPRSKQPLAIS